MNRALNSRLAPSPTIQHTRYGIKILFLRDDCRDLRFAFQQTFITKRIFLRLSRHDSFEAGGNMRTVDLRRVSIRNSLIEWLGTSAECAGGYIH